MAQLMSEAVFRLAYDGEAVANGEMDVADLAPALMGMAQLLKAAGRVVEGDGADISVRVKSTREACFEVWLTVAVDGAKDAWSLWKTPDTQAAVQLVTFLGFMGGGAIGTVKWLRGRRPTRIVPVAPGRVSLEVDGDTFEVPEIEAQLALDPAVRAALEKVIADPLESDGISAVELGNGSVAERIEKSEAASFKAIGRNELDEFESRHTKPFSIVSLSFKAGQKWRLSDGRSTPLVTMSDEAFQARVDAGQEAFAKGDILICEVVEKSTRTPTGFKSEYEIVKVVEHRRVQPPPTLPLGDGGAPEAS